MEMEKKDIVKEDIDDYVFEHNQLDKDREDQQKEINKEIDDFNNFYDEAIEKVKEKDVDKEIDEFNKKEKEIKEKVEKVSFDNFGAGYDY